MLTAVFDPIFAFWAALKGLFPAALQGGFVGLEKYFFGKIFGAFIPAFFLAGAIATWVPKSAVVKYLSPQAPRRVAYAMATVAGGLLSVCACGILPLFAAVYQRGAGIGPAMTFLFAGPAINLIAILYTFDLMGARLGVARIACALVLSVLVGLIFERLFEERPDAAPEPPRKVVDLTADDERSFWQTAFPMFWMVVATVVLPLDMARFFPSLAAPVPGETAGWLGVGGLPPAVTAKLAVLAVSLVAVGLAVQRWFSADERREWIGKTGFLLKQIVPKIVIGIFITGILEAKVGRAAVVQYLGHDGLLPSFAASLAGGVLYFGTILGVLAARFFQAMGVPDGPLLALLLAGPTVTLPSVLAISEIIGAKRSAVYFGLVVVLSTVCGTLLGAL